MESTKRILAIVIAFGGQWPHSTYMMPGGITCSLDESKLAECDAAIDEYVQWYERSVLGCSCEEWLALQDAEDFEAWLELPAHRESALGVFTRFGRSIGLPQLGAGSPHLLSAGCYYDPERWQPPFSERPCLHPGGFYDGERGAIEPFRQELVSEHLRYASSPTPARPGTRGTVRRFPTPRRTRRTATPKRPGTASTSCNSARWPTWCSRATR